MSAGLGNNGDFLDVPPALKYVVVGLVFVVVLAMIATSAAVTHGMDLPAPPVLDYSKPGDAQPLHVKNYKDLTEAIRANRSAMIEWVVTKTLYPIFQALIASTLAFIFGKGLFKLGAAYLSVRSHS